MLIYSGVLKLKGEAIGDWSLKRSWAHTTWASGESPKTKKCRKTCLI